MTYTSVLQYTEESVRQCKDLASFLKKRAQVEMEYAKGLFKLSQSFQRATASNASKSSIAEGPTLFRGGSSNSPSGAVDEAIRQQLVKTSVWQVFYDYVDQTTKIAESHRNLALSMQNNVLDPFTLLIKDMDVVRKMQVERGAEYLKNLQDAYASLKKAKEEYDVLQNQAIENQNNHMKARVHVGAKERELDKLANRAAAAADKAEAANEALQVCGEICKNAQEQYYGQLLPVLYDEIRTKELERSASVKKVLVDSMYLEKTYGDTRMLAVETVTERLQQIDLEEDIEEFVDTHMVDEPGKKGHNVSVSMLLNPVKAGRMLLKRGDFIAGWKSRYFVLMEEEQELYCFDNEAALKPREVISLKHSAVHRLDDSYFNRPHCFQVINVSSKGRQTYNLIAESANEKEDWIIALGKFAFCCVRGMMARDKRLIPSTPLMASDEEGYLTVRSFQLSVLEAKELPSTPGLGGLNPYCIVLFDDVKQARTTTKSGDTPFWGDEYEFEDICSHFTRLRIVIFNHSRLQRDGDLGYISINLNAAKPGTRVEQWYPIKQLPRPNVEDGAWRGSIRVGFCLNVQELLPASQYHRFIEHVTEPSLTCIRILGSVCGMQREVVAKVFMNILKTRGEEMQGLKTLLDGEIQSTENPNIIFRGNTIATKAVDQYMKMVGMEYLSDTIGLLVRQVYASKESCEVDPTRVEQPELLSRNWKRLRTVVGGFWDSISGSVRKCPRELVEIFAHIRQSTTQKWNSDESRDNGQQPVHYAAISGFIFLRFFCPAILNPKLFGLIPDFPDATTARTFTLIAKILQNLANLSDFGSKEPYMAECNSFIEANIDAMKSFIDAIATIPGNGALRSPSSKRPARVARRDAEHLYQFFMQNLDALVDHPSAQMCAIVDDTVRELRVLENGHSEFVVASVASSQSSLNSTAEAFAVLRGEEGRGLIPNITVNQARDGLAGGDTSGSVRIVAERPPQIDLPMFPGVENGPRGTPRTEPSGSFDDLQTILHSLGEEGMNYYGSLFANDEDLVNGHVDIGLRSPPSPNSMPVPPPRHGSRSTEGSTPKSERTDYFGDPPSPRTHTRKKSGGGRSFIKTLMGVGSSNNTSNNHNTNINNNNNGSTDSASTTGRRRFRSSSSLNSSNSSDTSWPSSRRGSEDPLSSADPPPPHPLSRSTGPSFSSLLQPDAARRPPALPTPPARVRGPRPSEESLSNRSVSSQHSLKSLPNPDDYGDPNPSPSSTEEEQQGRSRSISMGSKMKNRWSVMWKSG
ncbi:hypothetical protein SpCBS45565_g01494 [Spizellomyces sp. 'palustris']|nr:hypothetical protein SpCBS45565_g01494 [Spizellomyces sp. 'palustris']